MTGNGEAKNNKLIVSGGTFGNTVWVGYSGQGSVSQNEADISGGVFKDTVYGGLTFGGTADGNTLTFSAGEAQKGLVGGRAKNGSACGNTVNVSGGQISGNTDNDGLSYKHQSIVGGFVYDGSSGNAEKNVVIITGGTINTYVVGGIVAGSASDSAQFNEVHIEGGTITGKVFGGRNQNDGAANGNVVSVGSAAKVTGDVIGGESRGGGQASGNFVTIEGIVDGNVIAGRSFLTTGQAFDNTMQLSGNAIVTGTASAYSVVNSANATGGLIRVSGTISVGGLTGFDEIYFDLVRDNVDTAALTITNSDSLDLSGVEMTINGDALVGYAQSAQILKVSDGQLHLTIDDDTRFTDESSVFVDRTWSVTEQIVEDGGVDIDSMYIASDGTLKVALDDEETVIAQGMVTASEESHTLSESFLGSIAFVNQGAEFIADEGIRAMAAAATAGKVTSFGALHGGTSRYETGSHIDVDGVTLAAGAVTKIGSLMLAGFVEAGWANSESHVSGTKGNGDHDYYGVGTALRYSFENPFYIDGSVRFGMASTEFDGRYANASAGYDADSLYGSMHIGVGYVFALTKKTDLDVYGRYVLTYLEGDTAGLGTTSGEKFEMDDTMTHAFRLGTRLSGAFNESADWRFGLAYEHVADGDAESDVIASSTRASLDTPTLEGDTGIIEAGFTVRPNSTSPWSADIGIKGYVGDRKGVTGNAAVVYMF